MCRHGSRPGGYLLLVFVPPWPQAEVPKNGARPWIATADPLRRFQEGTRLVFPSGGRDEPHLQMEVESRRSLESWCVLDLVTQDMPWAAHELADAGAFNSALGALEDRKPRATNKLEARRARIDAELTRQLSQVETLVADGKPAEAGAVIRKVDALYGGLAAPRGLELAEKAGIQ
jgi:hypothetical protein